MSDVDLATPRPTIDEQLDRLETILHPRGRCVVCGGGEFYWKHMGDGDIEGRGTHPFTPLDPAATEPEER